MHAMIWILVLLPLCAAFALWQSVGRVYKAGDTVPWQSVPLGKHSFWLILTICYVAAFSAAFAVRVHPVNDSIHSMLPYCWSVSLRKDPPPPFANR
jgi:hypothetical protein